MLWTSFINLRSRLEKGKVAMDKTILGHLSK